MCIKYILVKTNEVEKLKVFALTDKQRKEFEDKKTPIPSFKNNNFHASIWDEILKPKKTSNNN